MKKTLRLLAAAALGLPAISQAAPSDYVRTPAVEYGEREIDFKYGTARLKDAEGGGRETAGSLGLGWGATQWWFTEAYLKYERNPGERTKYDAVEWENKFQLTEHNQFPVDFGLITEIEIPRHEPGYEVMIGPLTQFDTGPIRWNANLTFERVVRGSDEEEHHTEMGYQLQAKYTLNRSLELGVQAFGEMGRWNHWEPVAEQSHRVGPAIFGKVALGGREQIHYNAAWLFGVSDAAAKNTFRMQVEYEF